MAKYSLLFTSRAKKDIEQLSEALRYKISAALDRIAQNPLIGKLLKGELQGLRSYRVGDHRIIYQIQEREILVIVLKIGHRREVYRT